jgi:mono/diheme cytochrome c family protein
MLGKYAHCALVALTITLLITPAKAQDISLRSSDPVAVKAGQSIYAEHCAVCHGKKLEGQENWRNPLPNGRMPAPPHDKSGHTWHHSDTLLFRITKLGTEKVVGGDYKSDMPGFEEVLSDEQIIQVLSYIRSSWPAEFQKMHDGVNERAKLYGN